MTDKKTPPPPPPPPPPSIKDMGTGLAICTEEYSIQSTNTPLVTRNFTPTPTPPAPSRPGRDGKQD